MSQTDSPVSASSDEVLVRHEPHTMVITINRAHARNAVTTGVAEAVAAALDEFEARDDLSVAVITGAGGNFCAGMDLKGFVRGERPTIEGRGFAGITQAPPGKPMIAAVEGYALAGGCEIVLACDLVVAGRGARFGIPEVKRGLVASAGGLLRLPHRIPRQIAMELALTGGMLEAARGYELGLVNRLVDDGAALTAALALAEEIAANGPLATRASKRIIDEHETWPEADKWAIQRGITNAVMASADAKEGATAFAEKRAPRWQGR